MKLKRYDIKRIYGNPKLRRELIAHSTVVTMAREGIDITMDEALKSYDMILAKKADLVKTITLK